MVTIEIIERFAGLEDTSTTIEYISRYYDNKCSLNLCPKCNKVYCIDCKQEWEPREPDWHHYHPSYYEKVCKHGEK